MAGITCFACFRMAPLASPHLPLFALLYFHAMARKRDTPFVYFHAMPCHALEAMLFPPSCMSFLLSFLPSVVGFPKREAGPPARSTEILSIRERGVDQDHEYRVDGEKENRETFSTLLPNQGLLITSLVFLINLLLR